MEEGDAPRTSLDPNTTCSLFQWTGECKHGLKCRFLGSHSRKQENGELELLVDEERKARVAASETEVNFIDADTLRKIRTKKVRHHCHVTMPYTNINAPSCSTRILSLMCTCKSSRTTQKERRRKTTRQRGPRPLQYLRIHRLLVKRNPRMV